MAANGIDREVRTGEAARLLGMDVHALCRNATLHMVLKPRRHYHSASRFEFRWSVAAIEAYLAERDRHARALDAIGAAT